MVLLAVMAGAWAWVLWPAPPGDVGGPAVAVGATPAPQIPAVRLEQLDGGWPGIVPGQAIDPFRSRTVQVGKAASATAAVRSVPAVTTTPPEPPRWPRLELIGLAEGQQDGRPVRTAIVSGPTGVLHARPGDVLEQVYRVERVGPDGADLRLLPEDRLLRLALRP
jgi:hypothetical protein